MKSFLYISPGPTFNPHSPLFQSEYKELSRHYQGHIFTTSTKKQSFAFDNIKFISMASKYRKIDIIRFFFFCIYHALSLLVSGEKIHLVTTYDPLKTGLIGLTIAKLHGAKFAPQVNGVYTSPAEWLDEADSIQNKIKKRFYPVLMRFVLKHADGMRLLYKEQVDTFRDDLKSKIIHSFHCYVPTDQFKYIRENKEVLFAGFPFKRKGVDVLIDAFKKIAPDYPDWNLKILGWYPNKDELLKAIDGHPQIKHHPPVHYDQMIEQIGSCAILVLPSRSEAMGRVLVEAMAAEKPRIGSNVDGIPAVIDDGVDGLLVKPGDVDDLAEKLDRLMGAPELRRKLGKAGKARVLREFTEEAYFNNLLSFYREVLES